MAFYYKGERVSVDGDSQELGIKDYDVRVNTNATVEEDVRNNTQKKILVTLDRIDGDSNVCVLMNRKGIRGKIIYDPNYESEQEQKNEAKVS